MREDYYTQNKDYILDIVKKKDFMSIVDIENLLYELKKEKLVSIGLTSNDFLLKLLDDGLAVYSVKIRNIIKARYILSEKFDIYDFAYSLENRSFFPMFTALNIQKLSDFRNNFVFVSKERSQRTSFKSKDINQEAIDIAFAKKPRLTQARDKINGFNLVVLESNNTEEFEIIEYGNYKVSSVNRAFVEIISNIQYFKSSEDVIEQFSAIYKEFNLNKIYEVIEKFDFVYPYYQLAGYYLEQIGYSRTELNKFHKKKTKLKFYTVKNKESYSFDDYWNIYY